MHLPFIFLAVKSKKIKVIFATLSLCVYSAFCDQEAFSHHRDLQETVCFLHTDWDPPTDSRCTKEGENTSGIPVFHCCGPR